MFLWQTDAIQRQEMEMNNSDQEIKNNLKKEIDKEEAGK